MKNYESPIRLLEMAVNQLQKQVDAQTDEAIYKAIVSVGVSVDREELIRALQYDRDQYEKGYADGLMAGVEVVRCRDCVHNENGSCTKSENYDEENYRPDYYCADGERADDGDK